MKTHNSKIIILPRKKCTKNFHIVSEYRYFSEYTWLRKLLKRSCSNYVNWIKHKHFALRAYRWNQLVFDIISCNSSSKHTSLSRMEVVNISLNSGKIVIGQKSNYYVTLYFNCQGCRKWWLKMSFGRTSKNILPRCTAGSHLSRKFFSQKCFL